MIVSTQGIVIKTFNYRETSKIVEIFTESNGLVALIAKGVRNQPKLYGVFEPLNIVYVSFYNKKTQDLHLLSKIETISSYHSIVKNQEKLVSGLLIIDLIKQTQPYENPNKYLFDLTIQSLNYFKTSNINPFAVVIFFIIKLIGDLGFDIIEKLRPFLSSDYNHFFFDKFLGEIKPTNNPKYFPKISKKTLEKTLILNNSEINNFPNLEISYSELKEFLYFVEDYLTFHLDKKIRFNVLEIFQNDI